MQYFTALLLAFAASVTAQNCVSSYTNAASKNIFAYEVTENGPHKKSKREPAAQAQSSSQLPECPGGPNMTLTDGTLLDIKGRTGAIVANYQFQFDGPIQDGTRFDSGWSVCYNGGSNVTLERGGVATFWRCGDIHNLYDRNLKSGDNCEPVYLQVVPCTSSETVIPQAKGSIKASNQDPPPGVDQSREGTGNSSPQSSSSSPSSSTSSSSSTTSSSSTPSSSASSTASSTAATSSTLAPTTSAAPTTAVILPPPPPPSNSTIPVGTGTGVPPTTKPSSTFTPSPSVYIGAGSIVATGQKIVALVAAGAAFALL